MPTEQQIYATLDKYRDATLAAFEDQLRDLIQEAQDATIAKIVSEGDITKGVLESTVSNAKLARKLNDIFSEELDNAGVRKLIDAFTASFSDQLPSIHETLELLASQAKTKLPSLAWTKDDLNLLSASAVNAGNSIEDEIALSAQRAFSRVMFSVGGLPFKQMVTMIRQGMSLTVAHAKGIADTSQSSFYRVALERQYNKIEADTGVLLRYRYSGPIDKRERPFCRAHSLQTVAGKSWTKAEINDLDNGASQPKPVFLFCGGWLCRHQWAIFFPGQVIGAPKDS